MSQNLGNDSNVVGGSIEPDHLFPWVVSVEGTLTGKGVVIAPNWVLTAAHVVETSFGGAQVSYTRTDPTTGIATGGSQDTGAGSVKLHPSYVTGNSDFDLALVHLPAAFQPDPFLQPAALPTAAALTGQLGTVAGFSHTAILPPGTLAVLRGLIFSIGGTTFDARSATASLCPGDSGSGFITTDLNTPVVTGIASEVPIASTVDCTQPNIPFTSVEVFKHLDWIRSQVGLGWSWERIGGSLKHVSVSADGNVWGVNAEDDIFRRDGNGWERIAGALKQISVGNANTIWGVNADDKIFVREGDHWRQVPGQLKHVSVSADGNVWGVTAEDEIFFRAANVWKRVPGELQQVCVAAPALVWGVNSQFDIFHS